MTFGVRRPVEPWRVSKAWKRTCTIAKRRAGYACEVCGVGETFHPSPKGKRMSNLVAGHRVPPERYPGRPTDPANVWILCSACNASQGNRTPEEWQAARTGRLVDLGLVSHGPERKAPSRTIYCPPGIR